MPTSPGDRGRRRRRRRIRGRPLSPTSRHDDDDLALLNSLARRSRRRRKPSRARRLASGAAIGFLLVVASIVATVAIAGRVGGDALVTAVGDCSLADLRPLSLGENSFMFADDGSLLGVVPAVKNRQPLQLNAISPWLPKATVAIEDRRFYQHGALDYVGIFRALVADAKAGHIVQGGSTITQELVRNLYIGSNQRTISRKLREACLAVRVAKQFTKKQILAAYLNEVFYGHHAYGAEAAAQTFFSSHARQLTLTQSALLAGLPQAPTVYDPLVHPQEAIARRNEVLRAMLVQNDIDAATYSRAIHAPLGLVPGTLYSSIRHPNFFGFAVQQLTSIYGEKRVEAGGLRVRTTIDPRLQTVALDAMRGLLKEKTDPAAALVAIDPRTGAIKAMVNYLPSGAKLQFNLASQGHRQAGSAFKPFTLATALTQNISLYSTFSGPPELVIPDPQCQGPQGPWDVHNSGDESAGTMNLISATAGSVNTIFAQLVVKVGPENVIPIAHKMGIQSPLLAVCSITLGSNPVTPLEMTDAYATLAARGVHHDAAALAIVRGPDGRVIGKLGGDGQRALDQNVADQVVYAMEGVVQYGTGTAASLGSRPVAGKTGTAENYQDAWFCGFVPQLATCVWVGYPRSETSLVNIEGFGAVFGGTIPAEIWHTFMTTATANMPVLSFPYPHFTGQTVYGSYFYSPTTGSTTTATTGTTTTQAQTETVTPATTTIAPPTTAPPPPTTTETPPPTDTTPTTTTP
jgi:penicillin-binding protein 1A